jgi:uncharacterized protein (TIGR02996 family)
VSEGQALLAAILAAPDDDVPRLVYADWCEEQGHAARAEFVRAELEVAKLRGDEIAAPSDWEQPRYRPLRERAEALWRANAVCWYPGLGRFTGEISTHRGFPYHAAMSVRRFLQHGEALFALAPSIVDIFLDKLGKNTPALAACPALAHVRHLTFFETPFRAREADQFFASPHLANLRSFKIPYTDTQMGAPGALALARSPSLTALEHLDVFNHAIFDSGAAALLEADALASLRSLRLGNNGLSDQTAFALARASRLDRLVSLDLDRNHLTARGVEAICQANHLAGLEYLDLGDNPIGGAVRGLLGSVFAGRLRTLRLWRCRLDDDALAALFASDRLVGLTNLDATSNALGLGQRSALALAGSGALPRLQTLSVCGCGLVPAVAGVLARASLPNLRRLTLSHNPLGAAGVRQLLDGPLLGPVARLGLDRTDLGDEGAEDLAAAGCLPGLRSLHLCDNGLTDRAARALANSQALAGVRHVSLRDNLLSDAGKAVILARFGREGCSF